MSQKPKEEKAPPPRHVRCRFCQLTVTQTNGRYDLHGDCSGAGQIADYEHPATGDPTLDGLVVSHGAMLWAIQNMLASILVGDFIVAAMGNLSAHWWALSSTQWVRRFGGDHPEESERAP